MNNKQKAEEFIIKKYKINEWYREDTEETRVYMSNNVHDEYEEEYKLFLAGLEEGEKIGKEKQWIATKKAQKKTSAKIKELEKENAEMKELIEIQYAENQTLGNNNSDKSCDGCKRSSNGGNEDKWESR